jgi:DNA repair protein RadD
VKFTFRQYQQDAEDAVFAYLEKYDKKKHPLVALPTGSGKTPVIRRIIDRIIKREPDAKIVVLSHDSQILIQNFGALSDLKPGLYSAGLDKREVKQITIAGIQSVFRVAHYFREFDYIVIDEAHTIPTSEDSMYRKFIDAVDNHVRIGLTATPYRLGQGYIIGDDHLFDKIVIDLTFGSKYTKLIKDGYLSPLVINNTTLKFNVDDIATVAGDYSLKQMSSAFDRTSLTKSALDEMCVKAADRKKWLIFAIDIDHADNICDDLNSRGIFSIPVHSRMEFDKQSTIDSYRVGDIRCIVNVGMLTTGFDVPEIDMIGLLRPTKSPGLHVQMIGRGGRIAEGKTNCLVLDYAGNTARLGPVNRIKPYKKQKGEATGTPVTKTCPVCDTMTFPMAKKCELCGHEFEFRQLLEVMSAAEEIVAQSAGWYSVRAVEYERHIKKGSPTSIAIRYHCGLRFFKKWICPDHRGYSGEYGRRFLAERGLTEYVDLNGAIEYLRSTTPPSRIKVNTSGKYPEVIGFEENE